MSISNYNKSLIDEALCLTLYLDEGKGFQKPLDKQKEEEYFLRLKAGDQNALNTLASHNMRLVVHISKRFIQNADADDLISIGSQGLIKAITTFDITKGNQFSTYAAKCIENEILMYLRANKKHQSNVSIFSPIGSDKDGNEITLAETLYDESYYVGKQCEEESINDQLKSILQKVLTSREYYILCYRYGLFGIERITQREISEKLNISRSYISRIEKKAILKIRKYVHEHNIELL